MISKCIAFQIDKHGMEILPVTGSTGKDVVSDAVSPKF